MTKKNTGQEALPLFEAGSSLPTERLYEEVEPEARADHRAEFVAGIMSQYAFGEKPSPAQRAEAIKVAVEALARLRRFGS